MCVRHFWLIPREFARVKISQQFISRISIARLSGEIQGAVEIFDLICRSSGSRLGDEAATETQRTVASSSMRWPAVPILCGSRDNYRHGPPWLSVLVRPQFEHFLRENPTTHSHKTPPLAAHFVAFSRSLTVPSRSRHRNDGDRPAVDSSHRPRAKGTPFMRKPKLKHARCIGRIQLDRCRANYSRSRFHNETNSSAFVEPMKPSSRTRSRAGISSQHIKCQWKSSLSNASMPTLRGALTLTLTRWIKPHLRRSAENKFGKRV